MGSSVRVPGLGRASGFAANHSWTSNTRLEKAVPAAVPSSVPYRFRAAPQPAESTRIGRSPGRVAMIASARLQASSWRPACSWSAPQHPTRSPVRSTVRPDACSTSSTASCTSGCQASITHPVKSSRSASATGDRRRPPRSGSRAGNSPVRLNIPRRCTTARRRLPHRSRRGRPRSPRPSRSLHGAGRCSTMAARVIEMSSPKGTPDGQAVSQPRHCTQVDMASSHSASIGAPSNSAAPMREMRPRGDRLSSPVTR